MEATEAPGDRLHVSSDEAETSMAVQVPPERHRKPFGERDTRQLRDVPAIA